MISKLICTAGFLTLLNATSAQNAIPVYSSKQYSIYQDSIIQNHFKATAISPFEMTSNYKPISEKEHIKSQVPQSWIWKKKKDLSAFPQYHSDYMITDAIYNLSLEEMINAVEPDSTFRTGKLWAGVWTRDISYSIILSMAYLQPLVAMNSLMRKVNKEGRIIQDTGTGGAYPVSTDRMIWAIAAWEIYKVTGDEDWLKKVFDIIRNSVDDDLENAYDENTGLVHGESSFLDWREQTYPGWMQPADIYESENLGTNAVHYQANIVLTEMAKQLDYKAEYKKYKAIAAKIKTGINQYLWMGDKGYYGQYLYGRNYKILSTRSEALGEALCVLFNIADSSKKKLIIENTPVTAFGIPCIYPQIPNIPPYHNNAVWPFVESYWAIASVKASNETSVLEAFSAVERAAALFLTNKENFVAENGDYNGTQINSSNMLWSLSGNLSLIQKVLFGIEFAPDQLIFHPFVPRALKGSRTLTNFKYRNAILEISLEGYGNKIKSFSLDGIPGSKAVLSSQLYGPHQVKIILSGQDSLRGRINKLENYTTLETPVISDSAGMLQWKKIDSSVKYMIMKNGIPVTFTSQNMMKPAGTGYAEYQVVAVDKNRVKSFASEPFAVNEKNHDTIYPVTDYYKKSELTYTGFGGNGFIEISKTVNTSIDIPVEIKKDGWYFINFHYANGNGPINTENKCAIRSLMEKDRFLGTLVFPQRGKNDWNLWGYTNSLTVYFTEGIHLLTLSLQPTNENMNGEINQAVIDYMKIINK